MTLYLIGLGLNEESITQQAIKIIKKSKEAYLESYTVDFPYKQEALEKVLGRSMIILGREEIENDNPEFLELSRNNDICLLVYGNPLMATTHTTIIELCKKENIPYEIIHNASIFDAVAETGLQAYKYGKTASMPAWNIEKEYMPTSFVDVIIDNKKINAHTLLLVDIGLRFDDALRQLKEALENKKVLEEKIVVCSKLGTKNKKIIYGSIARLIEHVIEKPYCFIIPCQKEALHFTEEESLKEKEV